MLSPFPRPIVDWGPLKVAATPKTEVACLSEPPPSSYKTAPVTTKKSEILRSEFLYAIILRLCHLLAQQMWRPLGHNISDCNSVSSAQRMLLSRLTLQHLHHFFVIVANCSIQQVNKIIAVGVAEMRIRSESVYYQNLYFSDGSCVAANMHTVVPTAPPREATLSVRLLASLKEHT
jgi:hypothetical protein